MTNANVGKSSTIAVTSIGNTINHDLLLTFDIG